MGGVVPLLSSANSDSDAIFKVAVAHLCALIYDCLVIRETRTNSKPKKIQTIDNEQYDSHTDSRTVYV